MGWISLRMESICVDIVGSATVLYTGLETQAFGMGLLLKTFLIYLAAVGVVAIGFPNMADTGLAFFFFSKCNFLVQRVSRRTKFSRKRDVNLVDV